MPRKKLIAANWKMCKTPGEARKFVQEFLPLVVGHTRDEIAICPSFVDLVPLAQELRDSNVKLGAQDVFWEATGAYTGEVCAAMLREVGCTHVIIGHSERRQYFGETDDTVNRKLAAALEAGLTAIVCIGELLQEREAGLTDEVLRRQAQGAFRKIDNNFSPQITIAYEPVWAIGTGKTATPDIAATAHRIIRAELEQVFGTEIAKQIRILYGGSVKPENAEALMSEEEIDGALVGGASLDPKSFAAIVRY
jgi:triosephosphate isomerase